MQPDFNVNEVTARLEVMDRWKAIAFGLSLAEWMLPDFVICTRIWGCAGRDVLRSALDRAWQELGRGAAPVDVSDLAKACAASMPDMDGIYGGLDRRGANAADALVFLMEALMEPTVAGVAKMAALAHHNAELLAQDLEEIGNFRELDYEQRIFVHPTVQAELRRQHEDLEFLAAWSSGLRPRCRSWRADGRGMINS